jgi:segregation and condensation protein B
MNTLKRDVEALLFASGEPLSMNILRQALAQPQVPDAAEVEAVLAELQTDYPQGGQRGFELLRLAGGWALRTNPACREVVSALFDVPDDSVRLSPAAMEALAVVAYLQPVSRPQIAEVRGVNSDSCVQTLVERDLIADVGRSQSAGGAVLYGTTPRFEAMFGLADLEDLPDLKEFELSDDQKLELRRRLGLLAVPE